jgi:hypothetical protein
VVISVFLRLNLVMSGFAPNIMTLMSDYCNAGCMFLKGLSAAVILKLIAQPQRQHSFVVVLQPSHS